MKTKRQPLSKKVHEWSIVIIIQQKRDVKIIKFEN